MQVKTTFIDTSYLLALVLTDDALHDRAVAWEERVRGPYLTAEYVLIEFVDALAPERLRSLAVETLALLRRKSSVRVVPASTALMDQGVALFAQHHDKHWSATDCISFVVMREAGIQDALSSDHDFEQAGFRALLRHVP